MALILKDRVKESSSSSGTGSITLGGAIPGYQTFNAAIATGSTVYYTIHNLSAGFDTEWEVGVGTFTSPATLSRDTVFSSSSSGSKVNFTAGASGLEVFITQPSEQAIYINDATNKVEAFGNGANTITFTNVNTTNLVANSATLQFGTVNHIPADGLDIANKAYVDTTTVGLTIHAPVVVARLTANYSATYVNGGTTPTWNTITANSILDTGGAAHSLSDNAIIAFGNVGSSNLTAGFGYFVKTVNSTAITVSTLLDGPNVSTLTNGTSLGITSRANSGVGATLTATANGAFVQDGVTVSVNGRVLFNGQTNAFENGIYDLTTTGSPTTKAVLTRSANENTYSPRSSTGLGQGDYFYITSGAVNGGKSFVLATAGTLVFGTTNLTFDQFSATPVYSAGTGLTLTDTTFSITNTAVTSATYGDAGTVATFTVNAQGQLTNAANAAINASSITVGTLANARTTADSANGASTIVTRDSNGGFTANTITATTSNATTFNGTTGNFTNITGNGVALTAINASNVTSGTLNNARTTANTSNSASTIVVRDANGAFEGGNVTAANFIGAGTTLTSINASNISSGTVANARTTAASANGASTIVSRDSSGSFDAGAITATSISGNGVALSAINASNLTSGTVDNARTTAATANGASTIVLRGSSGEFSAGVITADGSGLSAINASNVSSGTLSATRGGTGSANLTAENVILGNGASAVKVVAPGTANNVLTSNGTTWISQAPAASGGFDAGTVMLFAQTTAPTGWTKNTTTGNNSALRLVTGTASTGGSVAFTTAFASQTPTGSVSITSVTGSAGATTLSTPQIPSHSHNSTGEVGYSQSYLPSKVVSRSEATPRPQIATTSTGGGGSHDHPFSFSSGSGTFSGNAINLAVQYIDIIRASKD